MTCVVAGEASKENSVLPTGISFSVKKERKIDLGVTIERIRWLIFID